MIDVKETEKLTKSLFKKAVGYTVDEIVEEYINGENEQNLRLIKRKITKKHIPPDISAAKALLDVSQDDSLSRYKSMSDEELYKKREELLKIVAKGGENESNFDKQTRKMLG